jgi:predicted GNAT family N-acyltransferase
MKLNIITGDWDSLRDHAQSLRVEVFVVEQGVPVELEWDEADEVSTHAVAYDEAGQVIATGRLLPDGHIGRMAVRKSARGQGIGSEVLAALLQEAKHRQFHVLVLHAQTHAVDFYTMHGFQIEGDEFLEAGIPHRRMTLKL